MIIITDSLTVLSSGIILSLPLRLVKAWDKFRFKDLLFVVWYFLFLS
nr:MAG TPA: hypothetical protein [Caudoviricetes sp.]